METYTIRSLMLRLGMTYEGTYSLVQRMRRSGLVKELGLARVASRNAKLYGLVMPPEQFMEEERNKDKSAKPPAGFYSNPFNLTIATDLRIESWQQAT